MNGGFLHYTDMKKFLKNLPLWNRRSDFEIISPFADFRNCSGNFDPSINMAVVTGGYFHATDMKKFLKNLLLWNHWSNFEMISQESSSGDPF